MTCSYIKAVILVGCLCAGILVLGQRTAVAQFGAPGMPLGTGTAPAIGGTTLSTCGPLQFPAVSTSLGEIEGGYNFWRAGDVNFGELWASVLKAVAVSDEITAWGYAYGAWYGEQRTTESTVGSLPSASLRFGGIVAKSLAPGTVGQVLAGYETIRAQEGGTWGPGMRADFSLHNRVGAGGTAVLGLTYYYAAGDPFIFGPKSSICELYGAYTQEFAGFFISLEASRYGGVESGLGTKERGWRTRAEATMPGNLFTLRGETGWDNFNGNYYSIGASLDWQL